MSDEYNPSELARDKRMRGDFAPIDAFEIARNNKEWYCPRCQAFVSAEAVTYEETHVVCGTTVTSDDTVITLAQENARLKADLAAIKGRTCATCKHVDHWTTSEDIDRYACAHNPRSTVAVTGEHFCGYHENKEAADA